MDGVTHEVGKWDLIVAHPPCTYLTNVATRHHSLKFTPLDKINARTMNRIESMEFFMQFVNSNSDHIAIENPVGVMNTCYRKPDMTIHPYMFADDETDTENYVTKATCFWLKGLPKLEHKSIKAPGEFCLIDSIIPPDNETLFGRNPSGKVSNLEERQTGNRAKTRSKTFPGIAKAIASQWGAYLEGLDDETKP